jgi:hypothetical protein
MILWRQFESKAYQIFGKIIRTANTMMIGGVK